MSIFYKGEYSTNQQINVKENVDPNLKPDTILKMGENDISYGELRNMYPINNCEPIKCLIYWDDIMQFTSFGLIEVINALKGFDMKEETIDFNHFFNRPNEYSNGLAYVFKMYEKVLDKSEIINIRDKYYWKILEMSIKSQLFVSIQKTSSFFDKIGFWFPVTYINCENLKASLQQFLMKNKSIDSIVFHYGNTESFHQALQSNGYNSVITPDIKSTYNYIIKNNLKRISLLGPNKHNGINDKTYEVFAKYSGKLPFPNYCSVNLYKEDVMII